jgi:hypothetical protein
VKYLPKQRVLILQDNKKAKQERSKTKSFFVDFPGCDILQLEETPRVMAMVDHKNIKYGDADPNHKMPGVPAVTLTVAGKCHFTSSNYRHFKSMMRTKEESQQLKIPPNGRFDWPGVESMLKCPFCNEIAPVPLDGDDLLCNKGDEYWMLFHPLLQIAAVNRSKMTIGTRTICRLTCLGCMQNHLHGKTIVVSNKPNVCGRSSKSRSGTATATSTSTTSTTTTTTTTIAANQPPSKLRFSLSALKVLNDAGHGSSIFSQQESPNLCHLVSHRNVNTAIDAWTLFNLWEYSGAHEALQTDYLLSLSQECIKRKCQ